MKFGATKFGVLKSVRALIAKLSGKGILKTSALAFFAFSTAAALAAGSSSLPGGENDFVFKAMSDELERSMTKLQLNGHPKPYYVAYTVREYDARTISASFGAITDQSQNRFRTLDCDVRIGDYKQDSSTGMGGAGISLATLFGGESSVPVDDNYDALRRKLWLETDSAYKDAIERFKANELYLKQHTVEDKPDSFSREKPLVHVEAIKRLSFDTQKWSQEMRKVSGVFREFPILNSSRADIVGAGDTRWYLNNEGFRCRVSENGYIVYISAQALAPDGMRLTDEEVFPAWKENELPTEEELEKDARQMADRLGKLAQAPIVSNYRGPVIFEGQAGAEFFHQLLDTKLAANPRSALRSGGGAMHERLGERFLPKFISVVDDPLVKEFNGQRLYGDYEVDDDGIPAQKITLIDKGILKTLCIGRVPTRTIKQSNGHAKDGAAATSNVFINSDNKMPTEALKTRLIELGKEDGLKEVYIVRKLLSSPASSGVAVLQSIMSSISSGSNSAILYPPVLLYKVSTEDGHEELCRGASFTNLSMRVLRDVDATGDDARAYPAISHSGVASIIAPSVLVKEVEIQRPARANSKGHVLPNPYFDKQ